MAESRRKKDTAISRIAGSRDTTRQSSTICRIGSQSHNVNPTSLWRRTQRPILRSELIRSRGRTSTTQDRYHSVCWVWVPVIRYFDECSLPRFLTICRTKWVLKESCIFSFLRNVCKYVYIYYEYTNIVLI